MDFLEYIDELDQKQTYSDQIPLSEESVFMTCEFCDEQALEESTTSAVKDFIEADEYRKPPYGEASINERAQ